MITYNNKSVKYKKNIVFYSCNDIQDFIIMSLLNMYTDKVDYTIQEYFNKLNQSNDYYVTVRLVTLGGF